MFDNDNKDCIESGKNDAICLRFIYSAPHFELHKRDCAALNKYRIELLNECDHILKFTNHRYQNVVPYVIYADFECLLEPVNSDVHICNKYVQCRYLHQV